MALNGPSTFLGIAADVFGRAQQYSREALPITSDGPLGSSADGLEWAQHSSVYYYRLPRTGPIILLEGATHGLEWAQHFPGRCSRLPQMGPPIFLRSSADGLEWAQHKSL
jgi:hypothetical protein